MRVAAAAAVALVGLVTALVLVLSERASPVVGSNQVPAVEFVQLRAGQRYCRVEQIVPAHTQGLRVLAGTNGAPRPRLDVEIRAGFTLSRRGELPGNFKEGLVTVPIAPVSSDIGDATVCITPHGHPVAFGGRGQDARLEYLRGSRETWLALAPEVAERVGVGKASFGGTWISMAALVLAVGAAAGAVGLTVATARR